jgi:hypothetical protein
VGKGKEEEGGRKEMTDLQLYILVAIPLVGILANTGLFVHLSSTMNGRFAALESRLDHRLDMMQSDMKDLNRAMTALETDVALLKDKAGIK